MTTYLNHSTEYKKELLSSTPIATRKVINYKQKNGAAPRFIFECAIKLNMKPLTSATAAIIFHRFFREVEIESYDEYVRWISHFSWSIFIFLIDLQKQKKKHIND